MSVVKPQTIEATHMVIFKCRDNKDKQVMAGVASEKMKAIYLCTDESGDLYYWIAATGTLVVITSPSVPPT